MKENVERETKGKRIYRFDASPTTQGGIEACLHFSMMRYFMTFSNTALQNSHQMPDTRSAPMLKGLLGAVREGTTWRNPADTAPIHKHERRVARERKHRMWTHYIIALSYFVSAFCPRSWGISTVL